jgi:hypothetical protein
MPEIRIPNVRSVRSLLNQARQVGILTTGLVGLCLASARSDAQSEMMGTWELRGFSRTNTVVFVELRMATRSGDHDSDNNSFDTPLASLVGLSNDWLNGPDADVQFRLVRDAGSFVCQGRAGHGEGAGTFDFTPDPAFGAGLVKRGYEAPTPSQQFQLALADVGYALVDELQTEGYTRPSVVQLVRLGRHDVTIDYLRGLSALGYRVDEVDRLIELRDHGVTPDYIRGLSDAGYAKLSIHELLKLRDHGVTPRYIDALARLGYKGLSTDDLLSARDHGVSASWAEGFQQAGYTQLTMRDLVQLRDHGVSPGFAASVHHEGGPLPSVQELIRRRDHDES